MGDRSAGQEGPTPDFIPGWFIPRPGNADTAEREAVRFIGTQDFPINFLRPDESVRPARPPQLGVCIQRDGETMSLAVPPGYWIVRDVDGRPRNWREEDFAAKWIRNNGRDWIAPVERPVQRLDDERPFDSPEKREKVTEALAELVSGGERPAWAGEPPAEGTRRRLILETIREHDGDSDEGQLELADAIEEALLKIDIGADPTGEVSPASTAMDVLDQLEIPRTREGAILTISDRVTVLADELVAYRRDAIDAGNEFDRISIPRPTGATGEPGTPRTLTLAERAGICIRRVLTEEEAKRLLASTVDAQALLRWLISDLIASPADYPPAEESD